MRIHVLKDQVINKIAAGEVVERPASVVKELVENALDADAGNVQIVLGAGGRDLVEVIDDGSGMSPEEAHLALQRHATSKIEDEEDLSRLATYGFRGEALPSIASVSRLTLETSDGDAEGVRIRVEGGRRVAEEPAARTRGTTVRVEHLFANVPARRKFLRAVQTEYRHALGAVNEAALACLDTGFRLTHDGREVYRVPPGQGLRDRAKTLFSARSVEGAMSVASEAAGMRLRGILGHPDAARRSSSGVHLFVNGRPVGHRGLAYALYTGYGELLG
ncbi:MAG: DNA mismatch repair endonuclease MutL, partial [bacterium]